MHNTPKENLEFSITFAETNLRYLLGDDTPDKDAIEKIRLYIAARKEELAKFENL